MKRLFEIDPWNIRTSELDKENKRLQESLTSIGNGYMGMRGNFEEGYSGDTHIGTYLAGVWFPDKTRVGWWKIGYPDYFGKVINAVNFILVDIFIDGHRVDTATDEIRDFQLNLDMKKGILTRSYIWVQGEKEVQLSFKRYVSVATKELAVIQVEAKVLKGSADVTFISKIDGDVENEDANYDEKFWLEVDRKSGEKSFLTTKTKENPFGTERFTVTAMMQNVTNGNTSQSVSDEDMLVAEQFEYTLSEGETAELTKLVSVVTSRDIPLESQREKAETILNGAVEKGAGRLEEEHTQVWGERWHKSDVAIEGDPAGQQGVRFSIFQLFSTYYGDDPRLNVGPKGFTGEKYGGATYWDTEACILPMYLAVTDEEISRQLLIFRHNQLEGAYINAKRQGLKGALYPMVTFTGVESHNEWEITFEEIHRNGAIAHAIFNYTTYTGDEEYLLTKGIDVLVAISRFWADRVHYSENKQKYMLHGVTGPNEYENNVNNNWYTNTIATWTLRYTLESLNQVDEAKQSELELSDSELEQWQDIIDNMYYPVDEEQGIFIQHDTFLDKELRTVDTLDPTERPLNQHWSWDKILRSPFIKQADVLQGLYFLNHEYTHEEKERNFDFYEPMTVHESSLSPSVHSILASELGKREKAFEMYRRTARLDLDNYNNDTEDGLHITSMSGGWLSIAQGFAGMRTYTGKLTFAPYCPEQWDSYSFNIKYRKRLIRVSVNKEAAVFSLEEGEPVTIEVFGEEKQLRDTLSVPVELSVS